MESIGELAQRTGTSRRMLRHWEAQGLLAPAAVDAWTGQRRYAAAQAGRVRAIAALREIGFGLEAIRDLLDQGLTEPRLVDLLRRREDELSERIAADSTALAQVRTRLRSIERDRSTIMNTLTFSALPAMELHGIAEVVSDETEIPDAVGRLLHALNPDASPFTQDVTLSYDGTTDDTVISVVAALPVATKATRPIPFAAIGHAAVVRLDERPSTMADVWIALDAELESQGLRAVGPYRQTLHPSGAVTLAVPVSPGVGCD